MGVNVEEIGCRLLGIFVKQFGIQNGSGRTWYIERTRNDSSAFSAGSKNGEKERAKFEGQQREDDTLIGARKRRVS